ncbi:hypothetical protein [Flavobacterium sp. N1994]|uniref:hypothetical protein n=1 Tax=Flavobacterium sp. N1994 TaxID=2986827 RepID=UPI0022216B5C|nr:hypothetical protein [Flavobacterium sp. N1994]
MKPLVAISFIVALFWQSLYQTGYILYWNINQDNIIKTECINRFKPMMHCNGKCVLYRQLKKAADEEAENNKFPVSVLKIKNLDTFIEMPTVALPIPIVISKQLTIFSEYTASPLNGFQNTLLKPPQPLA